MWQRGWLLLGLAFSILAVQAAAGRAWGAAAPQTAGAAGPSLGIWHLAAASPQTAVAPAGQAAGGPGHGEDAGSDSWTLLFVLLLATFVGLGVILRVSRLLHTPLMSLTNAISAIAVVGSILVTGADYPLGIRILGAVALFASMTNIVSGFLITDRMLRMFKQNRQESRA